MSRQCQAHWARLLTDVAIGPAPYFLDFKLLQVFGEFLVL